MLHFQRLTGDFNFLEEGNSNIFEALNFAENRMFLRKELDCLYGLGQL